MRYEEVVVGGVGRRKCCYKVVVERGGARRWWSGAAAARVLLCEWMWRAPASLRVRRLWAPRAQLRYNRPITHG